MGDFWQNYVPTLPLIRPEVWPQLEGRLAAAVRRKPVGVLIPCLYSDFQSPAMARILEVLSDIPYIRRVYVSLDRADAGEFETAVRTVTDVLGSRGVVVWNDSPRLQAHIQSIEAVLPLGPRGKGRAVWTALGYVLGEGQVAVLAFHDADILTYDRAFLGRLLYPVIVLGFQFAKGFYVRYGDQLYGRVVRLFYFPFVRALKQILGPLDFLEYMGDFRYPLAGEMATFTSILRDIHVPADWGIEVGFLAEAYRLLNVRNICQVEITDRYDHKHQATGPSDFSGGLTRMVVDIARAFFVEIASRGVVLPADFLQTLRLTFIARAQEYSTVYGAMSEWCDLAYSLHEERSMIELFGQCIDRAVQEFQERPVGLPRLPTWHRLESALTGILDTLVETVQADLRDAGWR